MLTPAFKEPSGSVTVCSTRETLFAGVLTGLFLVVGMAGALRHDMWRDEMHAWLLARDSSSLWNVFQVTRYEAHFALWRVILYGLARVTHNPMAMQIVSLLLAGSSIWIVARFSPFRRWEKQLFSFGYFTLNEYCIIVQDYTLIVLLLFCFCALYRRRDRSYLGLSVVLCLMANSAPYGFAIALVLSALLALGWLLNPEERKNLRAGKWNLRASALILLGGCASAGLQLAFMKLSPSTAWKPTPGLAGLADTVANVWRAYVPIPTGFPDWRHSGWGTNFLLEGPLKEKGIAVSLAIVCLAISVGILVRRPAALFLYGAGVGTLLWVQFVVSVGALRHTGFLFLLFVASLWVWDESPEWELSADWVRRLSGFFHPWRRTVLVGLLVIHLVAGLYFFGTYMVYPFSGSKLAAQYIRDHGLTDSMIVGSEEKRVAPICGYLDRQIFYPDSARFGSYIDYSKPVNKILPEQLVKLAWQFALQRHQDVVMVLSSELRVIHEDGTRTPLREARIRPDGSLNLLTERTFSPSGRIKNVAHFRGAVDEDYYIYQVRPD